MHPTFDRNYAPKYAVYGLGVTGMAAMHFFRSKGIHACCWDDSVDKRREATDAGYLILDFCRDSFPASVSQLLISPGIPWNGQDSAHPAYRLAQKAKQQDINCICDIECLLQNSDTLYPKLIHPDAVRLAITGTNGKTSVVHWLEAIVAEQGFRAKAIGNNGVPALGAHHQEGLLAFELSSYQLDLMQTAGFHAVALLNVSADHLERYGNIDTYVSSKAKILDLLHPEGVAAVIGVDDPYCAKIAEEAELRGLPVLKFSIQHELAGGIYLDDGCLIDHRGEVPLIVLDPSSNPLLNNLQHMRNLVVVYALLCHFPIEKFSELAHKAVRKMDFAHRQNPIALSEDVVFIDDSKATNPIAAADALRQFRNIHWIAGGQAKAGGFDDLQDCFDNVEAVYLFGAAAAEMESYLRAQCMPERCVPAQCAIHRHATLDEVMLHVAENMSLKVQSGKAIAPKTVLFSPACASFDQYANYIERGKAFQGLVYSAGAQQLFLGMAEDADLVKIASVRRGLKKQQETALPPPTDAAISTKPFLQKLPEQETLAEQGTPSSNQKVAFFANWLAHVDKISIVAIFTLFAFGLVVQSIADVRISDISFAKQAFIGSIGLFGMLLFSMLPRQYVMWTACIVFVMALIVMILVPIIGIEIKGGTRWITIPVVNFAIQPVEIFKIAAISVFAIIQGYACNMGYSKTQRNMISLAFLAIAFTLIIVQPDFSQSLLMLSSLAIIAILAAELPLLLVLISSCLIGPAVFTVAYYMYDHVAKRFDDFWLKNYESSDQVALAKLTAQKAPWFDSLNPESMRPWHSLSDVESDFVFVLMMQELGKFLALLPLLLILLILYRAISRLWFVEDIMLRFWLWGIVVLISAQTFINLATATGVIPPTGMTLPLISYGGSSLLGIFFAFGILLFITRDDVRHS